MGVFGPIGQIQGPDSRYDPQYRWVVVVVVVVVVYTKKKRTSKIRFAENNKIPATIMRAETHNNIVPQ